jgi:hypothetical protein
MNECTACMSQLLLAMSLRLRCHFRPNRAPQSHHMRLYSEKGFCRRWSAQHEEKQCLLFPQYPPTLSRTARTPCPPPPREGGPSSSPPSSLLTRKQNHTRTHVESVICSRRVGFGYTGTQDTEEPLLANRRKRYKQPKHTDTITV